MGVFSNSFAVIPVADGSSPSHTLFVYPTADAVSSSSLFAMLFGFFNYKRDKN